MFPAAPHASAPRARSAWHQFTSSTGMRVVSPQAPPAVPVLPSTCMLRLWEGGGAEPKHASELMHHLLSLTSDQLAEGLSFHTHTQNGKVRPIVRFESPVTSGSSAISAYSRDLTDTLLSIIKLLRFEHEYHAPVRHARSLDRYLHATRASHCFNSCSVLALSNCLSLCKCCSRSWCTLAGRLSIPMQLC